MRLRCTMLIAGTSLALIFSTCSLVSDIAVRSAKAFTPLTPQWQYCYDRCLVANWNRWCTQTGPGGTCPEINGPVYEEVKQFCRNHCNAAQQ